MLAFFIFGKLWGEQMDVYIKEIRLLAGLAEFVEDGLESLLIGFSDHISVGF